MKGPEGPVVAVHVIKDLGDVLVASGNWHIRPSRKVESSLRGRSGRVPVDEIHLEVFVNGSHLKGGQGGQDKQP